MKRFNLSDEQGFTLIELSIAIAIFAIGMLAVVTMQSMALKNKSFSAGLSVAMRDQNQVEAERLMSLSITDAAFDAGTHGPTVSADGIYSTSYAVTDNTPVTGLKTLVITTSWKDIKGAHSATLTFVKDATL